MSIIFILHSVVGFVNIDAFYRVPCDGVYPFKIKSYLLTNLLIQPRLLMVLGRVDESHIILAVFVCSSVWNPLGNVSRYSYILLNESIPRSGDSSCTSM